MKRRIFTLAVFLLLGAIVNVAIAWTISLIVNPFAVEPARITEKEPDGSILLEVATAYTFGTRLVSTYHNPLAPLDTTQLTFETVESRGWPALSVATNRDDHLLPMSGYSPSIQPFLLRMGSYVAPRALPLRICWPGFT